MCFLNELVSSGHVFFHKSSLRFVTLSGVLAQASVSFSVKRRWWGPTKFISQSCCEDKGRAYMKANFCSEFGTFQISECLLKRCLITFMKDNFSIYSKSFRIKPEYSFNSIQLSQENYQRYAKDLCIMPHVCKDDHPSGVFKRKRVGL